MGRSGSGKGTQIELLKKFLENNNQLVYHFESGNLFRSMIKAEGYSSDKLRTFLDSGNLVPDFLTDWLLINNLINNLENNKQILILDGYPRTMNQVDTLASALLYYDRKDVVVLHIEVSEQEVRRRMYERARGDDMDIEAIENRIEYYNQKVLPTIEKLRNKDNYKVIDIDGEGDINRIQDSIKQILNIN